jgi:1-acyl-sn-glycerol-3-phosphate acyltransferase
MTQIRQLVRALVVIYYKLVHQVTVEGLDKLPERGPYVVAANHISNHDPVVLAAFVDDSIRFMAKEELFRVPVLGNVVRRLAAFPVRRQGIGIGGVRCAIRLLRAGDVVGIFPEGTRNRTDQFLSWKPGVGFVAVRADFAPIVPIAICAKPRRFVRAFHVVVGEPIVPTDGDYRLLTEQLREAVERLASSAVLQGDPLVAQPEHCD